MGGRGLAGNVIKQLLLRASSTCTAVTSIVRMFIMSWTSPPRLILRCARGAYKPLLLINVI